MKDRTPLVPSNGSYRCWASGGREYENVAAPNPPVTIMTMKPALQVRTSRSLCLLAICLFFYSSPPHDENKCRPGADTSDLHRLHRVMMTFRKQRAHEHHIRWIWRRQFQVVHRRSRFMPAHSGRTRTKTSYSVAKYRSPSAGEDEEGWEVEHIHHTWGSFPYRSCRVVSLLVSDRLYTHVLCCSRGC